jgi:chromate reductase
MLAVNSVKSVDWGTHPYGRNSWSGKAAAIIGASPGAVGTAIAQQHLRQVLGDLGALVMGGEAYLTFKPDLIDEADTVTDAGTRRFLQSFASMSLQDSLPALSRRRTQLQLDPILLRSPSCPYVR